MSEAPRILTAGERVRVTVSYIAGMHGKRGTVQRTFTNPQGATEVIVLFDDGGRSSWSPSELEPA